MPEKKVLHPTWYSATTQETPKKYTKKVSLGGYSYTAIDAQYQVMLANEHIGLYGDAWGVTNLNYSIIPDQSGKPLMMSLDATFFYTNERDIIVEFPMSTDIPMWSKPRKNSTEPPSLVTDPRKKLLTDLTTKSLSKIGFSADVFLGYFDNANYKQPEPEDIIKKALPPTLAKQMRQTVDSTQSIRDLNNIETRLDKFKDTPSSLELKKLIDDKKTILQP